MVIKLENPFKYSNNNKRYYTADYYYKNKYKSKTMKVTLDAHFSCPNRDGKISTGGCSYCSENGSAANIIPTSLSLEEQFEHVKNLLSLKWPEAKYIAYFQSYSNTYGTMEKIKTTYDPFVKRSDIVAIDIATRPDCFSKEIYDYLENINKEKELYIELGLQTSNDNTAAHFNRGYEYKVFENTVKELHKRNIKVIVHLINGLPNETEEDMLQTIKDINKLPIHGIKFHMLGIMKHTLYEKEDFPLLEQDEYLNILVKQLEILKEDIVVYRICSDPDKDSLIRPLWLNKKKAVHNNLDKLLSSLNTYQGRLNVHK
ncbi:MAG: TIGR01212 family radical SAM protein [Erysipelotrichaceae bacterium]|nr:TIGR01212 family radical SAM protein [Erysipelotrichaceae bacterium]